MAVSIEHKFEVGDKVRIVDVDAIVFGCDYWNNEDVAECVGHYKGNAGKPLFASSIREGSKFSIRTGEFQGIELIEPKLLAESEQIAELARQVAELSERMAKIERNGSKDTAEDLYAWSVKASGEESLIALKALSVPLTPNQERKAIIAEAHKFVKDTIKNAKDEDKDIAVPYKHALQMPWSCSDIRFEINAEKRTVVALAIASVGGKVVKKAIAKCMTDDVFNAGIGRAIATAKLFGLDFEKFADAVQPDEIAVGQRVSDKIFSTIYTVRKIDSDITERKHGIAFNVEECFGWLGEKQVTIVDDTDAQYAD